jgi:MFS family permease
LLPNKLFTDFRNAKYVAISAVLVINAFVWYYFAIDLLKSIVGSMQIGQSTIVLIWVLHFGGIGVSALVGASIVKRNKDRSSFMLFWLVFGTIVSFIPFFLNLKEISSVLLLSPLLGVSLGLGMPCCMGYFSENVAIEKRGRTGGTIFLLSILVMVALTIFVGEDIYLQTITLSILRIFGLAIFLAFFLTSPQKQKLNVNQPVTYKSLLNNKQFLLYLIPWTLFSLITYLTVPLQSNIIQNMQAHSINILSADSLQGIENIFIAFFAVIGGFLADFAGRKRMSIIGFAMLGLGYSFLGIYPENPLSWYFYTVIDGAALGILFVIFITTIWADISHGSPSEKYYAVGVLPFFISYLLTLTVANEIVKTIPANSIFSFTAIFLFLAVLPLVYAPETLPEKTMNDRDLKNYAEKALKQAKKEGSKKKTKTLTIQ